MLQVVLQGCSSAVVVAGLMMVATGLGLVEGDPKMLEVANVFAEPLNLPLLPFLAVGGLVKTVSALAVWDLVPGVTKKMAVLGLATPATMAIYGHWVAHGPDAALPPTIYLGILGSWYYVSSKHEKDDAKKN